MLEAESDHRRKCQLHEKKGEILDFYFCLYYIMDIGTFNLKPTDKRQNIILLVFV